MIISVFLSCLTVEGEEWLTDGVGSCYHISTDKLTLFDARTRCGGLGGWLVRIDSADENAYLSSLMTGTARRRRRKRQSRRRSSGSRSRTGSGGTSGTTCTNTNPYWIDLNDVGQGRMIHSHLQQIFSC